MSSGSNSGASSTVHPAYYMPFMAYAVKGMSRPMKPRRDGIASVSSGMSECRGKRNGAQGRNRTTDTVIFSHVLYQLSYLGAPERGAL